MKKFTSDEIKKFCVDHYVEYLEEPDLAIFFDFIAESGMLRTTFAALVRGESEIYGPWECDGCCYQLDDNTYTFKFKRTA